MKLNVFKGNELVDEVIVSNDLGAKDEGSYQGIFIGRADYCHVKLDGQQISREHAKLNWEKGFWHIESLSNLSHVMLNGIIVTNSKLNSGDVISVPPYSIYVTLENSDLITDEVPTEDPNFQPLELDETVALSQDELNFEYANSTSIDSKVDDEFNAQEEENDDKPLEPIVEEELSEIEDEFPLDLELQENDYDQDRELEGADFNDGEGDVEFDSFDQDEEDQNTKIENTIRDELPNDFITNENESDFSDDSGGSFESTDHFSNDSFDSDSHDNEKTQIISPFVKFELELFGESAPYDRYIIEENEVYIGRDEEKCQIILQDLEVSNVNTVLRRIGAECYIEDLQSSNGTILNGERINKAKLNPGDEFVIGTTTFTFSVVSEMLESEKATLMPLDSTEVMDVEEYIEPGALAQVEDFESESVGDQSKLPKNRSLIDQIKNMDPRRRVFLLVLVIGFLLLFMDVEEEPKNIAVNNVDSDKKIAPQNTKSVDKNKRTIDTLSKEKQEYIKSRYLIATKFYDTGNYKEAMEEFENILMFVDDYKQTRFQLSLAKQGLEKFEQSEKRRLMEEERIRQQKLVKELVAKASKAVEERRETIARKYFSDIIKLDPENIEVSQLKIELDNWVEEERKKKELEEKRKREREKMLAGLKPGKMYFNKKEWHRAINALEKFLLLKKIDEDLIKDASNMLSQSKENLDSSIEPLLNKSKNLQDGQDLKGAYETYLDILKINPDHLEALKQTSIIREVLDRRAKKVYREALISESLSLFEQARERFEEVKQISPLDSEYYIKAENKLKDYLD